MRAALGRIGKGVTPRLCEASPCMHSSLAQPLMMPDCALILSNLLKRNGTMIQVAQHH